jgi:hypothetical protein
MDPRMKKRLLLRRAIERAQQRERRTKQGILADLLRAAFNLITLSECDPPRIGKKNDIKTGGSLKSTAPSVMVLIYVIRAGAMQIRRLA